MSILLVLLEHASLTAGFPLAPHGRGLGHLGYLGVTAFFGISGFLITLLLVREWHATTRISLVGFYRRRAFRILPAYVAFLLTVFLLTRLDALTLTRTDWRAALTYTVNFVHEPTWEVGHLWSLSVEEQFYLIWPIVFGLRPAWAKRVLGAYLLGAPILRLFLYFWSRELLDQLEGMTPLRLDALAMGCLLALMVTQQRLPRVLQAMKTRPVTTAAVAVTTLTLSFELAIRSWGYGSTLRFIVDAVAISVVIWSLANARSTMPGKVLEARPIALVGMLSYSLYLWQQLFLNPHHPQPFGLWTYHLMLIGLIGVSSHYAIERPFLRLKERDVSPRRLFSLSEARLGSSHLK